MAATPPTVAQLISLYFPTNRVGNATCVLAAETATWAGACGATPPESCVVDLPPHSCYPGQPVQPARAFGPFKLVDVCWDPGLAGQANTPFTPAEWANILDPNYNVWAASVVYSIAGWRAWTTCGQCPNCPPCVYANPPCELPCSGDICAVSGEPIPYPRGPVSGGTPPPTYGGISPLVIYGALGLALYGLAYLDWRGYR